MIGERIAQIRKDEGLSLRDFSSLLYEEAGYDVSHTTLRQYEDRESVPTEFVMALSEALDVDPRWLLTGDAGPGLDVRRQRELRDTLREIRRRLDGIGGGGPEGHRDEDELREAWRRFQDRLKPGHVLRTAILRSWKRSRNAGVEADPGHAPLPRMPDELLDRHLEEHASLVDHARPHLDWLSEVVAPVPHVAYLASRRGIVLHAVGAESAELEEQCLAPGFDWSEESAGTNGVGTALATGRPTVVFGPEHYAKPFHDFACAAVPIRAPGGEIVGGVDLSTPLRHGHPGRLGLIAYVGRAIEYDMEHSREGRRRRSG